MPRYFFQLRDHDTYSDQTGSELPDDNAARREAVLFLGSVLREEPDLLWDGRDLQVHVFAEDRRLVCTVVVVGVSAEPTGGE